MPIPAFLDSRPESDPSAGDPALPLSDHLIELRRRLLICLAYAAVGSALCYRWSGKLLGWLAHSAGGVVFTLPAEAFLVRIKAAVCAGLILFLPLILHQVWIFVARALNPGLRRLAAVLAAASYILCLVGASLAVFVVVPAAMRFLLAFGTDDIKPLMTLSGYLGFVTSLALSFAAVFQLPIVLVLLNRLGIVTRQGLRRRWRYIYLLAFIVAGVLSPSPDVFSQLALAVPALIIFELTLLALR